MGYSKTRSIRRDPLDKNGSLGNKPRRGKYFHCLVCSKECYVKPSQSSSAKYCSYTCKAKKQENKKELICAKCGKAYQIPASQHKWAITRGHKATYCSQKCQHDARRNDWTTDERRLDKAYSKDIRYSIQFKEWRQAVFERDNYTCQRCGVRGTSLEPHHIFRFTHFPEFRFNVTNGMTLCRDCHQLTKRYDKIFKLQMFELQQN